MPGYTHLQRAQPITFAHHLLAYAMMAVLSDGIWNIAEAFNGIKMVGMPELSGMNITMAILNLVAIVTAVITNFAQKSK